ncbi:MAG: hypothetical protein C0483_01360 [Pirellula sp.]|nr:hypothetical protein [Pirellula sp.]
MPPQEPDSSSTQAEGGSASNGSAHGKPQEPFAPLLAALGQWSGFASHYFTAQSDLVRLKIRRVLVLAMAWLFGRIALYVAIGYAMFLVLHGISGGIAELCGHREWAGNLITGGLFLAILGTCLKIGSTRFVSLTQRRIQEHYEHRRRAANPPGPNATP